MNAAFGRISLRIVLAASFSLFASTVQAVDITVMSDSPLEPALTKVVDLYRLQTHNRVSLVFDPSPVVKKRIEDGEAVDVVIVQPDFAEDLTKAGKASTGGRPIIVHVGVGLGNRKESGQAFANVLETVPGEFQRIKGTSVGSTCQGVCRLRVVDDAERHAWINRCFLSDMEAMSCIRHQAASDAASSRASPGYHRLSTGWQRRMCRIQ
jgi:hypothetical protein